jgi:ATP-dependent RNA helicase DHX37/DHR1
VEFDSNAIILPARPDGEAAPAAAAAAPAKRLSKSQQRKLRRIAEEKERRSQRAEVLASLAQHQLGTAALGLLRPVATRGQRDSKKQALRRELALQRAGIDLPPDSQLFKQQRARASAGAPGGGSDGDDSGSGSGSDSDVELEGSKYAAAKAPRGGGQQAPAAAAARGHGSPSSGDDRGSSSSSSSEDEGAGKQPAKRQKTSPPPAAADAGALRLQARQALELARRELGAAGERPDDPDDGPPPGPPPAVPPAPGPARVVHVRRPPAIEEARAQLPIVSMEQEIMEAVAQHDVVVLCGETGCGKTTQVPQFLLEAGYGGAAFADRAGAVGVTQPRRVAAVSTAARVAEELGGKLGEVVGYQVRTAARGVACVCVGVGAKRPGRRPGRASSGGGIHAPPPAGWGRPRSLGPAMVVLIDPEFLIDLHLNARASLPPSPGALAAGAVRPPRGRAHRAQVHDRRHPAAGGAGGLFAAAIQRGGGGRGARAVAQHRHPAG